jgi:hypothetical protein
MATPPPAKTFEARCETCKAVRSFEEFSRERRRLAPQRGELAGGIQFDLEFSFQCRTCGWRADKLIDAVGVLHKWNGRVHATFKP